MSSGLAEGPGAGFVGSEEEDAASVDASARGVGAALAQTGELRAGAAGTSTLAESDASTAGD